MLEQIVRRARAGGGSWKLMGQVDKLIDLSKGEGKCSLIDMPVAPIRTGLALFREEFEAHFTGTCGLCAGRDARSTAPA